MNERCELRQLHQSSKNWGEIVLELQRAHQNGHPGRQKFLEKSLLRRMYLHLRGSSIDVSLNMMHLYEIVGERDGQPTFKVRN